MCTLTAYRGRDRLLVTMNRDELLSRAGEQAPRVSSGGQSGPLVLAPRDGVGSGTWMGVNGHGLVACLLNLYKGEEAPESVPPDKPSRGGIVPAVLAHADCGKALEFCLRDFDPRPYASFTLLLADGRDMQAMRWSGEGCMRSVSMRSPWTVLSSSSWRREEVLAWRVEQFERWLVGGAVFRGCLPAYHLLQPPERRAWAPLMERDYAATRSITQVEVPAGGGAAIMRYWRVPLRSIEQPDAEESLPVERSAPLEHRHA